MVGPAQPICRQLSQGPTGFLLFTNTKIMWFGRIYMAAFCLLLSLPLVHMSILPMLDYSDLVDR